MPQIIIFIANHQRAKRERKSYLHEPYAWKQFSKQNQNPMFLILHTTYPYCIIFARLPSKWCKTHHPSRVTNKRYRKKLPDLCNWHTPRTASACKDFQMESLAHAGAFESWWTFAKFTLGLLMLLETLTLPWLPWWPAALPLLNFYFILGFYQTIFKGVLKRFST